MDVQKLKNTSSDFLKTYGYISKEIEELNAIHFYRPTGLGVSDELLVYFHNIGNEKNIVADLQKLSDKYSDIPSGTGGRRFFLSPKPIVPIPTEINTYGFTYQIPVWFFDRELSSRKVTTPLKRIEKEIKKYESERIEQPYVNINKSGSDLLKRLSNDIINSETSSLRIIIAPAGYGKTVLMSTLYKKLLENFLKNKSKLIHSMRPLLMLPGHLSKNAASLDNLISNFIGDEYDYGAYSPETFKFHVKNGYVIMLLDGLEELILQIPEDSEENIIYKLLNEYIFDPNSDNAQVVLSIRKPLLATIPEISEYIDEWIGTGIEVYELCDWNNNSKRKYFNKNLNLNSHEKEKNIKEIETSEHLNKLCTSPFYCKLIADLMNNHQMGHFYDQCQLVEYSFDKICEREFEKGIDKNVLPVSTQKELFVMMVEESMIFSREISIDLLDEISEVFLSEMAQNVKENHLACLHRHSLLTETGKNIDFVHDIIKQFITSLCLYENLKHSNLNIFNLIEITDDSLEMDYLVKNASSINWENVFNNLHMLNSGRNDKATAFRNILKIFLKSLVDEKEKFLKVFTQGRNLTGLVFNKLDLKNFEFEGSLLNSIQFIDCNLSGVNFNGCHFKDTTFINSKLTNATTKDAIYDRIIVENKTITDLKEIKKFFLKETKVPITQNEPCQATVNLRKVIERVARKGRGYKIPRKFLSGMKCSGGINVDLCLNQSIRQGLLIQTGEYISIKINSYQEVQEFVYYLKMSKRIKLALDNLCRDRSLGCNHVSS